MSKDGAPREIRVVQDNKTGTERDSLSGLLGALKNSPIPSSELNANLALYLRRQDLSRILFVHELYQKIVGIHGVIMEFGVRWGANLSLLTSLRGIYEPYNYSRKIIGFDTFEGFAGSSATDGKHAEGDYSVSAGYETQLAELLTIHETFSPIPQIRKHELVKGDVRKSLPAWLEKNPQALVALAYFDMDIYEPTKVALEKLKPRLHKGSILVFDELCCPDFPGETTAVMEMLDLKALVLRRHPHQPFCSWVEL